MRAVAHVNQAICSPQDEGGRSMRSAKDRPNQACCFRLYNYCEGELPLTAYICILPPVFERNLNTYLTVVFPMVVVLGLRIFQSRGLRICSSLGRRSLTLSEVRRQKRYLPQAFIHAVRLAVSSTSKRGACSLSLDVSRILPWIIYLRG